MYLKILFLERLNRKCHITIMIAALLSTTAATWAGTTYYVDPNGDDINDGSQNYPFATIQKGITDANGGSSGDYDIVHVNSGTYLTSPIIIDNNNLRILFEDNVTVQAFSLSDPNDPNNPNDPNSFAYYNACLFSARSKSNIIFDGNDTIFEMRKLEYEQHYDTDPAPGEQRHCIELRGCTNIEINDFASMKRKVTRRSLVYFDPPYRPISKTSSFTSYSNSDFNDTEQIRLAGLFRHLNIKGAKVMLSNSDPKNTNPDDCFFDDLYSEFTIHRVSANRMINSKAGKRGSISELIITNY